LNFELQAFTMDGVLVVDKPVGPTSHEVVATTRRALELRRVGHTGTLDPLASGVLPLVLGCATRLARYLTAMDKEYRATLRFGIETDSYDSAGRVTHESHTVPTRDALIAALDAFRGEFEQHPPSFSAKKIAGERAYRLARKATPVALTPVRVIVHTLELSAFEPPRADIRLVCSAGFYVRSLAHDLGCTVGTGAILEGLVRTRSGAFSLTDAVALGEIAAAGRDVLASRVIPVERLLLDLPAVHLTADGVQRVSHGRELRPSDWEGNAASPTAPTIRLLSPDGRMLGIAEPSKIPGFLHPAVVIR
jgi:tRNA pseudouridine55 synthase